MLLQRERPLVSAGLLPAPAPLPSLRAAFSRRAAIFGAVVAPMALASPAAWALAPAVDEASAMAALHAEADPIRAATDRATTDDEIDRLTDRLDDVERRAVAFRLTTPAGAAAALEWVRADLLRHDGTYTGFGFYPDLIGRALGVLRSTGAAT